MQMALSPKFHSYVARTTYVIVPPESRFVLGDVEERAEENDVARASLGDDGIVRLVIKKEVIHLEDAQLIGEMVKRVGGERPRPNLVDMRSIKSATREARMYFANHTADFAAASALVTKSGVSRVLGNFALGVTRPKQPSRLFTSEESGIEWLHQYLAEERKRTSQLP